MINLSYGFLPRESLDYAYIVSLVKQASENIDYNSYAVPGGTQELKNAVARFVCLPNERYVCSSVSTALSFNIVADLLCRTKRIATFSPTFSNYYKQVEFADYEVITYPYHTLVDNSVEFDELQSGDLCSLVIPNNPTGELPDVAALESTLSKLQVKDVRFVLDISWLPYVYDSRDLISISEVVGLSVKYGGVSLLGFTKIFGVTSIRCSGVVAKPVFIEEFCRRHDQLAISCGTLDEMLVAQFLNHKSPVNLRETNSILRENSEFAVNCLESLESEVDIVQPKGGIFLYFYLPHLDTDALTDSCKKNGLLIYPSSFFENLSSGVRLCISASKNDIGAGIKILGSLSRTATR